MEETSIEDLGLSEDMSWESELAEKKSIYSKIHQMKHEAFKKAYDKKKGEMGDVAPPQQTKEE